MDLRIWCIIKKYDRLEYNGVRVRLELTVKATQWVLRYLGTAAPIPQPLKIIGHNIDNL